MPGGHSPAPPAPSPAHPHLPSLLLSHFVPRFNVSLHSPQSEIFLSISAAFTCQTCGIPFAFFKVLTTKPPGGKTQSAQDRTCAAAGPPGGGGNTWEGAGEGPEAAPGRVSVCIPHPGARTARLLSSRTWAPSLAGHVDLCGPSVRTVLKLAQAATNL